MLVKEMQIFFLVFFFLFFFFEKKNFLIDILAHFFYVSSNWFGVKLKT